MGKRKQMKPTFADKAKRRQLEWNMTDQLGPSSSGSNLSDDSSLKMDSSNANSRHSSPLSSGVSSTDSHTPTHALCVDAFYQNLAACHSTITLLNGDSREKPVVKLPLKFGKITITLTAHPKLTPLPEQLPEFEECWLYLGRADNPCMLYFETVDNSENVAQQKKSKHHHTSFGVFWFVTLNVPVPVLTGLKNKSFMLVCDKYDAREKALSVTIYGAQSLVMQLTHPSETIRVREVQLAVQRLMACFYHISLPYDLNSKKTSGHDFYLLYENVMLLQREKISTDEHWASDVDSISHKCLKPKLRPYQKESVAWMLRQEKRAPANNSDSAELHPLYCEVQLQSGQKLFFNKYIGSLIQEAPKAVQSPPGGILADEMGLGKTVEVLCCMLLHPRTHVDQPEPLPVLSDSHSPSQAGVSENQMPSRPKDRDVSPGDQDSGAQDERNRENPILSHNPPTNNGHEHRREPGEQLEKVSFEGVSDCELAMSEKLTEETETITKADGNMAKEGSSNILIGSSDPSLTSEVYTSCETIKCKIRTVLSDHCDLNNANSNGVPEIPPVTTEFYSATGTSTIVNTNKHSSKNILIGAKSSSTSSPLLDFNSVRHTENNECSQESNVTATNHSSSLSVKLSPPFNSMPVTKSNSHEEAANNNKKIPVAKRKRKSKGFIEYVPVTEDCPTFFSTTTQGPKQFFECNCGQLEDVVETSLKGLHTVKCGHCGMSQHAECMNYDLTDPLRGEYLCPHCHALHSCIKSGATLIISPYSICHQWIEEISKHIKECSIRVLIYTGVSKLGYIQPQTLAQQDIVITTYDVLRKEVDYANLPHTNSASTFYSFIVTFMFIRLFCG